MIASTKGQSECASESGRDRINLNVCQILCNRTFSAKNNSNCISIYHRYPHLSLPLSLSLFCLLSCIQLIQLGWPQLSTPINMSTFRSQCIIICGSHFNNDIRIRRNVLQTSHTCTANNFIKFSILLNFLIKY